MSLRGVFVYRLLVGQEVLYKGAKLKLSPNLPLDFCPWCEHFNRDYFPTCTHPKYGREEIVRADGFDVVVKCPEQQKYLDELLSKKY